MAKYQWRLEYGTHFQDEPDAVNGGTSTIYYRPGDIIDTNTDLGEKLNSKDPMHPKKVTRVDYSSQQNVQALSWIRENQPEAYAQYLQMLEQRGGPAGAQQAILAQTLPQQGQPVPGGTPHGTAFPQGERIQAPAGTPRNQSLADDLKDYSVRELQAYAETNEIDVEGLTRKADLLQRIIASHSPEHASV